jgi:hypothetical protein
MSSSFVFCGDLFSLAGCRVGVQLPRCRFREVISFAKASEQLLVPFVRHGGLLSRRMTSEVVPVRKLALETPETVLSRHFRYAVVPK